MRRLISAVAALSLLGAAAVVLREAGDDDTDPAAAGRDEKSVVTSERIGVILPDEKTSQRWVSLDPVFLAHAFTSAGVPFDIRNARGDRQNFMSMADSMIATGVTVLMVVNLDSESGGYALKKAREHGVTTIDYDRLTLNGGADYYVGFDNQQIGRLQARTLLRCLDDREVQSPVVAALNGSPDDSNSATYKEGYDSILTPLYDSSRLMKGPEQWVPDWSPAEAHSIFEQMIDQQPRITAVVAANDGMANAVIDVLKARGRAGEIPVTGQDATVQGLQNVLAGHQCMTVYKEIRPEAESAARLAVALFNKQRPALKARTKDVTSGAYVPSILLTSKVITRNNVKDVVEDGFVSAAELCTKALARYCRRYRVTK